MIRLFCLICSVILFGFSCLAVLEHWKYDEIPQDVGRLLKNSLSSEQLQQAIEQALQEDAPVTARRYLQLADTFAYSIDREVYEAYWAQIHALEAYLPTTQRRLEQFAHGFIEGEGSTVAEISGSVTADFTVVGDVRDLYEQYQFSQAGEPVNQLVVTLAGVGIALTAATVVSGGSAGVAKSGVSTLKLATRSGRLQPAFQRYLIKQGQRVFDYQRFWSSVKASGVNPVQWQRAAVRAYNPKAMTQLGDTLEQVNSVRRSTSLADTVVLLRYVETTEDLKGLKRFSQQYGELTPALLRFLGRTALGTVRVLRYSLELLLSLLFFTFFLFLKVFLFYRYLRVN